MSASLVDVTITPLGPTDWPGLEAAIKMATGWTFTDEVYSYVESVTQCTLTRDSLTNEMTRLVQNANLLFEGRFFCPDCEVRWIRQPDGTFRAWVTKEDASGGRYAPRGPLRYYLIGTYKTEDDQTTCREDRYPGKLFHYPISGQPTERARAYIDVKTYIAADPQPWPQDADTVEALLNKPAVVAHRFVGVGFGTDIGTVREKHEKGA